MQRLRCQQQLFVYIIYIIYKLYKPVTTTCKHVNCKQIKTSANQLMPNDEPGEGFLVSPWGEIAPQYP